MHARNVLLKDQEGNGEIK